MPRRLDFVRFQVDGHELQVAFLVAPELAEPAARTRDAEARSAAERIRGAGASRPIRLSPAEQVALAGVIDAWGRSREGAPATCAARLVVDESPR